MEKGLEEIVEEVPLFKGEKPSTDIVIIKGNGFYPLPDVLRRAGSSLAKAVKSGIDFFVKEAKEAYKGLTKYGLGGTFKWVPDEERLDPTLANEIMNASNYGPYTPTLPGYNNPGYKKDKSA